MGEEESRRQIGEASFYKEYCSAITGAAALLLTNIEGHCDS